MLSGSESLFLLQRQPNKNNENHLSKRAQLGKVPKIIQHVFSLNKRRKRPLKTALNKNGPLKLSLKEPQQKACLALNISKVLPLKRL